MEEVPDRNNIEADEVEDPLAARVGEEGEEVPVVSEKTARRAGKTAITRRILVDKMLRTKAGVRRRSLRPREPAPVENVIAELRDQLDTP